MHYPVIEVIDLVANESAYIRFFKPTPYLWYAKAKLAAFKLLHVRGNQRAETRIVDADRAAYLIVSYAEWKARRNRALVAS